MADFQDQAYTFLVESVLEPQEGFGRLLIEASADYLLTTAASATPQPEQTVSYVIQPDGRRIARSTVTLLAAGPTIVNGTVTLRDPLGQAVMLRIEGARQAMQPFLAPMLTISGSELLFNRLELGEVGFAILKISQQGTDTPVVLRTDDPTQFELATGIKELNFGPDLTLTPSPGGTYIHIRYTPRRAGRHQAQLFIETPYDTKTVSLQGRAVGLLPIVLPNLRLSPRINPPARQTYQPAELDMPDLPPAPKLSKKRTIPALLLVGLGGLGLAGYTYRCQIVPSLCQARDQTKAVTVPSDTAFVRTPASTPNTSADKLLTKSVTKEAKADNVAKPEKKTKSDPDSSRRNEREKKERSSTPEGENLPKAEQLADAKRRASPQQKTRKETKKNIQDESDLEKELNNNLNF